MDLFVEWIPTKQIVPNPMNPRKNEAVLADQMISIIQQRGWEEPLTAYKKGKFYILLAGHRRLYAAKKAKIAEVPVYIVEAPKNEQEEIERIASLQSGRVDWEPWDWASFTYERWVAWSKPSFTSFARRVNLKNSSVKQYITVLSYYPHQEIEPYIQNKTLSFSTLYQLVQWIRVLVKHKGELVNSMGEDLIRKIMVEKLISRKVSGDSLRNTEYCELAKDEQIQEFLINKEAELDSEVGYLGIKKKYKNFTGHLISISHFQNRIPAIKPETALQKQQAVEALAELKRQIEEQLSQIR